jgi:replicative DNA helicase
MEGRIPPHSIEAEKSVLGASLLSKDALFDVVEVVRADDFYDNNHKEIFKAIVDLNRKNVPVDALTVSEELKKRNSLNMVGGRAYIASLSSGTPTTANAQEYAKIVAEKASIRRLISTADDIVTKGYEENMMLTRLWTTQKAASLKFHSRDRKGSIHISKTYCSKISKLLTKLHRWMADLQELRQGSSTWTKRLQVFRNLTSLSWLQDLLWERLPLH